MSELLADSHRKKPTLATTERGLGPEAQEADAEYVAAISKMQRSPGKEKHPRTLLVQCDLLAEEEEVADTPVSLGGSVPLQVHVPPEDLIGDRPAAAKGVPRASQPEQVRKRVEKQQQAALKARAAAEKAEKAEQAARVQAEVRAAAAAARKEKAVQQQLQ
eukprot:1687610-Prymnesium_polylepis.1